MCEEFPDLYYFPAYELVNDVLRDYRFYEPDMVHPSQQAADFVFEKFLETVLNPSDLTLLNDIKSIISAKKHKPFHRQSEAYLKFKKVYFDKATAMKIKYPDLELEDEIIYFAT